MRVVVRVRETSVTVDVGPGHQRLKWLAMVALQRYREAAVPDLGGPIHVSHGEVATGLMDTDGNLLSPNKSIRVALSDGQEVFAILQGDQEEEVAIKSAKGNSRFLMMQGAAPSKCIISGPGITYALVGHSACFSLQARDTYGNMTANGGEKFEVKVSPPDSLAAKQLAEAEPDPPQIIDRGDGSYLVSHTMSRKGRYEVSVELDGEPIAGSPFATVATKTFVPPMIKWIPPRIPEGPEPAGFSHAAVCTYGRSIIIFGGMTVAKSSSDDCPFTDALHTMHIEKMKWEVPKVLGAPRAGVIWFRGD